MNRLVNISSNIKKILPRCRLGLVSCRVANLSTSNDFELMLERELKLAAVQLEESRETLHPIIAECRAAYKSCGKEPSRYRPSAEALLRRIRTGKELYRISNIVDTINILSFTSHFSIGGFHLDAIQGPISLDIGDAKPYAAIGRGALNIEFMPGLRDEVGFFGTPTSDSERTMVRPTTENLLLVYYDFGGNDYLEEALENAKHLLMKYCNASVVEMTTIS